MPAVSGLPAGSRLFETSGSTGRPVAVVHSNEGLRVSAAAVNAHLGVDRHSCWGLALPRRHVGGHGVVVRADLAGCRLAEWPHRWEPAGFARWLADERVTHSSLVPTQVHDLVAAQLPAPASLQAVVVGGGRLDPQTGQAARDLGWPVLASYGLTEAASQVATADPGSLGEPFAADSLPVLPIWELACDPDGRIRLRGPALCLGWVVHHPDGPAFLPRHDDWFETQDRGRLDEAGHLTVLGRADQLVKVLGELVDPLAIEEQLARLAPPGTLAGRIAVVALPDPRRGCRLVPLREAACPPAAATNALTLYHQHCPGFARLEPWRIVAQLPRSPLGKLHRAKLPQLAANPEN